MRSGIVDTLLLTSVVEDKSMSDLRRSIRTFIGNELDAGRFVPAVDSWLSNWDVEFTQRLAAAGFVGMTIPSSYGGHGLGFLERFVVTEELLAAGAPLAAHWFADRQVAPALLSSGTPGQKEDLLPRIARGQVSFAIGMSEPESGSDLASVRTRAVETKDGWRLTGAKTWTSFAHRADFLLILARTSPRDAADRHAGLSQFIVNLREPGVTVSPIMSMRGDHHFNDVFLDDVHVRPENVLGTIGCGWQQVVSELAFERSGPERVLSTHLVLEQLNVMARESGVPDPEVGRFFARMSALRSVSISVAAALARREKVDLPAGVVKMLGTATEGDLAEHAAVFRPSGRSGSSGQRLDELIDAALLARAGFTIRGGTNEVLQGVMTRGLRLR